MEKEDQAK